MAMSSASCVRERNHVPARLNGGLPDRPPSRTWPQSADRRAPASDVADRLPGIFGDHDLVGLEDELQEMARLMPQNGTRTGRARTDSHPRSQHGDLGERIRRAVPLPDEVVASWVATPLRGSVGSDADSGPLRMIGRARPIGQGQIRPSTSFSTSMNFCSGTIFGAAKTTLRTLPSDCLAAARIDSLSGKV